MMAVDLPRRLFAEALGTMLLVATVVGSGIMAERLTGDVALARDRVIAQLSQIDAPATQS